jgi:predicted ATPase with chaperone activity
MGMSTFDSTIPKIGNVVLIGPGGVARRIAGQVAESLPAPHGSQFAEMIRACQQAGLRCTTFPDPTAAPFRAPHFSAHLHGIFGGGKARFPGEIVLAARGVLFFQDIGRFEDSIVEGLAAHLVNQQPASFPRIFIHAESPEELPSEIATLELLRLLVNK